MSVMLADIELIVNRINTNERRGLAEHHLPGLDGSVFQDMGTEPVSISLEGTIHGEEALTNLEGLRSKFTTGEPVNFVADIATATELEQVLIEDLVVMEVAGRPNHFRYNIKLRQYESSEDNGMDGLQPDQISQEAEAEAETFLKETETEVALDSGLAEIGAEAIQIGDQLTNITDLLKDLGLLDLFGYSAPTFNGKVLQVFDDLTGGFQDMIGEKDLGGKAGALVKTFALILGKAILTDVSGSDESKWDGLKKSVGKAVSS